VSAGVLSPVRIATSPPRSTFVELPLPMKGREV
jgi:hypothetical protein